MPLKEVASMTSVNALAGSAGVSLSQLENIALRCDEGRGFSTSVVVSDRGSRRTIVRPGDLLDMVVKNLHRSLPDLLTYEPPRHVHGFVKGRSTITNAREHLAKPCVLRVDLLEFFPSISSARVFPRLIRHGLDEAATELLLRIATLSGRLPIGLSTSPLLSNIAFEDTDLALAAYSTSANLTFTRYVDDLIFSGDIQNQNLYDIQAILQAHNWVVNDTKTGFMRRGGPQYVTGLYVGDADRPRIPKRIKRKMRWICHMIDTVGVTRYIHDFGGNDNNLRPDRLFGWARYIAAVEPEIGFPMMEFIEDAVREDAARMLELVGNLDDDGRDGIN